MTPRIAIDAHTLSHRALPPDDLLRFAREHRFDGVQFLHPPAPGHDSGRLADTRDLAASLDLDLHLGLPSPNPVPAAREQGRPIDPADHARSLIPHLAAVAALGARQAIVQVGDRHDRFRRDVPWTAQVDAAVAVLQALTPALLDHGVRLAVENHADLTADELLAFLRRLHPDVVGVALDTGNLPMRLDDPVRAVERLAPFVLLVHVKDCVLARTPRGLRWQARPAGSGVLPLPDILAPLLKARPDLPLVVELHPRARDLPTHDPSWLAFFPDITPDALAPLHRLADLSEARFAAGSLEHPDRVDSLPWPDLDLEWLALSLGYLRSVLPALARVAP